LRPKHRLIILRAVSSTETRRTAIREILAEGGVRNQHELHARLKRRGLRASQPVLSRDLRVLGVAKQGGTYQLVESERITPLGSLKSLLRAAESVPHFVMVHCEPGAASAVARALEAEELPGLIGSVAGDDTVLVAVTSAAVGRQVRRRVAELAAVPA
jgi:transcriptional regulator of arginine metabolism